MTPHRNALVILLVASLAATSITPTFAKPNNGAYAKSSEAFRKKAEAARQSFCDDVKTALDNMELAADIRAGTKEAKPYADEADALWAQGERAGCSWAA